MNYYPFHAGDYAAHTSHLTWEEDIAYRRMLDLYYLHEKALPQDHKKIARLIRMPDSVEVITSVLEEFFVQSDGHWHSKRADEELEKMAAKQEQQQAKDAHESERMRRYRERRSVMFAALREVGVVPAWDVSVKELQRLLDENCNAPATHLQREQVENCNAPATAIPTPTPTPTPIIKEQQPSSDKSDTPANFAELWKAYPKKVGKSETLKAWKAMKINGEFPQIMEALERQKLSKKWQEGFILDPVRWVKGRRWEDVVEVEPDFTSLLSDQITPIDCGDSWKDSASGITVKGRSLGIEQQPGEPFPMFKIRVIEASQ